MYTITRRRALAGVAGAGLGGLGGCVGGTGGSGGDGGAGDAATLDTHPAARDLSAQPRFGPPPGEAAGTVVAFEDPSCPTCARFERETVPRIRSELAEPGDATFVFRVYPVVYEWGKPASRALEATFARDDAAHWTLADHYFGNQSAFDAGNVLDRTRAFLDRQTDVDGTAVVDAVKAGEADPAVEADRSAAADAGADGTPSLFLFRDGEYRTKAVGSVSFDVVKGALGL